MEQPNQTDQNVRDTNDQSEDGGHLAARFEDSEEEEDEGCDSQEHTLNGERLRHTLRWTQPLNPTSLSWASM